MNINELLDTAKRESGLKLDSELAKALGYKAADISHWRAGRKYRPNIETAYKLGEMAKLKNPAYAVWLAEREGTDKPEKRQFWDDVMRKAAVFLIGGFVSVNLLVTPTPSQAAPMLQVVDSTVYIMSNKAQGLSSLFYSGLFWRLMDLPARSATKALGEPFVFCGHPG